MLRSPLPLQQQQKVDRGVDTSTCGGSQLHVSMAQKKARTESSSEPVNLKRHCAKNTERRMKVNFLLLRKQSVSWERSRQETFDFRGNKLYCRNCQAYCDHGSDSICAWCLTRNELQEPPELPEEGDVMPSARRKDYEDCVGHPPWGNPDSYWTRWEPQDWQKSVDKDHRCDGRYVRPHINVWLSRHVVAP